LLPGGKRGKLFIVGYNSAGPKKPTKHINTQGIFSRYLPSLVAGVGFKPATFGLCESGESYPKASYTDD
jgi:hypothetical protein